MIRDCRKCRVWKCGPHAILMAKDNYFRSGGFSTETPGSSPLSLKTVTTCFFGRFATHAAVIWRNIRRRQCSRESSIAYYDDSVIDKRIHDTHCLQECALSSLSLATAGAEATGSKEEVLDELVLRQKELILDSKSGSKGKKAEKAERAKKSLIWDVEN